MRLRKVADKSGDEPARNHPDVEGNLPDPSRAVGALLEPWPLSHVEVLRAGPRQNFSPKFVNAALMEGWLALDGDRLTVKAKPKKLVYRIVRAPGRHCCYCSVPLDGEVEARTHVALLHALDGPSPDASNPSGYACLNHYECERVS